MTVSRAEFVNERYGTSSQGLNWSYVTVIHKIRKEYNTKRAVEVYIYLLIESILDHKFISIRGIYSIHILSPNRISYTITGTEFNLTQLSRNINITRLNPFDTITISIEIRSYGQKILQFVRHSCKTSSVGNISHNESYAEEKSVSKFK